MRTSGLIRLPVSAKPSSAAEAPPPVTPRAPRFEVDAPAPRWSPPVGRGGKGLDRLSLLDVRAPVPALDFGTYRVGYNNRGLFGAIVKNLVENFGVPATTAYTTDGIHARPNGTIGIDEKKLDAYVAPLATPEARRAMVTFVLAHEYFHVYLRHVHFYESKGLPKEFKVHSWERARPLIELQADYLAAKVLRALGLPADDVLALLANDPELANPAGKDYPRGALRAAVVESAEAPGIRADLFQNDALDCLAFLDFLAGVDYPKA